MAKVYPAGPYTNVHCYDNQHSGGEISDGKGTYSGGTFSCGDFADNDHPKVGSIYRLTGEVEEEQYEFPGWKYVHAGKTSDFRKP
jgi:hypothetical protein